MAWHGKKKGIINWLYCKQIVKQRGVTGSFNKKKVGEKGGGEFKKKR